MFRCLLWGPCGWSGRNRNRKWTLSTYILVNKLAHRSSSFLLPQCNAIDLQRGRNCNKEGRRGIAYNRTFSLDSTYALFLDLPASPQVKDNRFRSSHTGESRSSRVNKCVPPPRRPKASSPILDTDTMLCLRRRRPEVDCFGRRRFWPKIERGRSSFPQNWEHIQQNMESVFENIKISVTWLCEIDVTAIWSENQAP